MVTIQFRVFSMELCQCNWHLFPIDIQRMLLIFISHTQQPIFIRSYGNILCTREFFKQVQNIFLRHNKWNEFFFQHVSLICLIIRQSTEDFRTLWCFGESTDSQAKSGLAKRDWFRIAELGYDMIWTSVNDENLSNTCKLMHLGGRCSWFLQLFPLQSVHNVLSAGE